MFNASLLFSNGILQDSSKKIACPHCKTNLAYKYNCWVEDKEKCDMMYINDNIRCPACYKTVRVKYKQKNHLTPAKTECPSCKEAIQYFNRIWSVSSSYSKTSNMYQMIECPSCGSNVKCYFIKGRMDNRAECSTCNDILYRRNGEWESDCAHEPWGGVTRRNIAATGAMTEEEYYDAMYGHITYRDPEPTFLSSKKRGFKSKIKRIIKGEKAKKPKTAKKTKAAGKEKK